MILRKRHVLRLAVYRNVRNIYTLSNVQKLEVNKSVKAESVKTIQLQGKQVKTQARRILELIKEKDKVIACKQNNEFIDLRAPIIENSKIEYIYKNLWEPSEQQIDKKIYDSVLNSGALLSIVSLKNSKFRNKVTVLNSGINPEGNMFYIDLVYFKKEMDQNKSLLDNLKACDVKVDLNLGFTKDEISSINDNLNQINKQKLEIEILDNFNLHQVNQLIEGKQINESNGNLVKILEDYYLLNEPIISNPSQLKMVQIENSETIHLPIEAYQEEQKCIRLYGTSFLSSRNQKQIQVLQENIKKRDHRYIGKQQELFLMHKLAPGSPFFLPNGLYIIDKLKEYLKRLYTKNDYMQVQTPLLFKKELFDKSGHWQNYKEDMFQVSGCCGSVEEEVIGLKPMNCPAHCLIFDSKPRLESDLPIRLADFGTLHRNEASGALTGLTRVRQFHQDDAHIFCTKEHIHKEIENTLKMLNQVYTALQLPHYELSLSTRPKDNFIGKIEEWEHAEEQLKLALNNSNKKWYIKEGDGAFYGPKIDIMVKDNHNRKHQTATIQLDFQLPNRFELKYRTNENQFKTPVIIHRAIFGSLERMFAILVENNLGKWPFWINPKPITILPLPDEKYLEYSIQLADKLKTEFKKQYNLDLSIKVDKSNKSLSNKIKHAQQEQFNFMLIIGDEEINDGSITIRKRDNTVHKNLKFNDVLKDWFELLKPYL